jgi:biotin carboxyl carrier protein
VAYVVSVSDRVYRIELTEQEKTSKEAVFDLLVNGVETRVSVVEVGDPSHLSLIIDDRSYDVVMEDGVVSVEGLSFEVEVEDELRKRLVSDTGRRAMQEERTEIRAPMPGLVVAVEISQGEKIAPGQGLIVLEAMKMQNELKAPRDGVVKQILVKQGAKVNGGDLLAVVE